MTRSKAEAEIYTVFHRFPVNIMYDKIPDFGLFTCKAIFSSWDYAMAALYMLPAHWTVIRPIEKMGPNSVCVHLALDEYIEGGGLAN